MKRILAWMLCLLCLRSGSAEPAAQVESPKPIIGITIDDSWYESCSIEDIVSAITALPYRPVARVVMSREMEPEAYVDIMRKLSAAADIMACPVDSYEMKHYETAEGYLARFRKSYALLHPYVSLWEIGNEINGEGWLGEDTALIAEKMTAAYDFVQQQGAKSALTAYYSKPGEQRMEMLDWLREWVPQRMKDALAYLWVSYYEDDNADYLPDWKTIFQELAQMFPHSLLGIGECGVTAESATAAQKIARIRRYYTMPRYTERFVGGYFWWYWVQDCLPIEDNVVYKTFQALEQEQYERRTR